MNCTHQKDDLVLLFYDELDAAQRSQVEARVDACAACRAELASLQTMAAEVPRKPLLDVSDAEMERIRYATSARLVSSGSRGPVARISTARISAVRSSAVRSSAVRWAVAAVIAVFAFGLGRMTSVPEPEGDLANLASASVSEVQFDSHTGMVQVAYEAIRPGTLSGTIEDAGVQQLLGQALHMDSPPLSRMRAARALAESTIRPNAELVAALEGVLVSDPNAATRLQALKAIQQLHEHTPVSGSLRSTLLDLVVNEPNTAIRMRALDAVTQSEGGNVELTHALEVASQDLNPHIRRQATMALMDMQTSQAL